ncbi:MAG: ABC transporter ATP-binding protein [Spirochaetota bacterium]|nr:ABC transporter ATP-binding protein [Spirochaetota bacterium]
MLNINKICAGYDAIKILDEISLKIDQGETRSIVGTNNSGKSTLFKVISGLLKPESGEITFDGINITGMKPREIVDLGIILVPERRRLFTKMTVYENLLLGSFIPRGRKERQSTLEFVYHLFPVLKERSGQLSRVLSGGEQQMLAIARGIMAKPRLLLLDEPSLGLSPLIVQNIFSIFKQLNKNGVLILLSEQNAEIALKASNHSYVLSHGSVMLQGESKLLLDDNRLKDIYLGKIECKQQ